MARMEGRVAVITGGSSGIGLATALAFAGDGAAVVIAARGEARGMEAARRIADRGGNALFVPTDVADAAAVERLMASAVDRFQRLDFLVSAAAEGGDRFALTADFTEHEFDHTVAVDVKGVWLAMKFAIPRMLAGGGGAIVNVSSVNGLTGTPQAALYCLSKHAVHGLTKTAALEYARRGIRINTFCPGAYRTPMLEGAFARFSPDDPSAAETMYREAIPLHRLGDPAEAAACILWLCSEAASYVTGHTLIADGGLSAKIVGA
jgi:NAD(P)-dependent dehydrogenase (short-subunit alcohol dehydrogenase family)